MTTRLMFTAMALTGCGLIVCCASDALCDEALSFDVSAPADAAAPTVETHDANPFALARDPFWPVGFKPRKEAPEIAAVDERPAPPPPPKIEWPELSLEGFVRKGEENLAMVRGIGLVHEGDRVTLTRNGMVFEWKIEGITDNEVLHRRLRAVPLKERPQGR